MNAGVYKNSITGMWVCNFEYKDRLFHTEHNTMEEAVMAYERNRKTFYGESESSEKATKE